MTATILIPARLESTRLKHKLLLPKDGKPLLVHVYEGCKSSKFASPAVATDSATIEAMCKQYNIPCYLTRSDHPNGSSRIAEVALRMQTDIIVNVQGDEPLIEGKDIDQLIERLESDPTSCMATLYSLGKIETVEDPNTVKVIVDRNKNAACFSRELRNGWQHIGVYAYKRDFLLKFAQLGQSVNERRFKLEQLRAMDNGYDISMVYSRHDYISIDTKNDYERWVNL